MISQNKKIRSGSIAGRINNRAFLEVLMVFIVLDLLTLLLDNRAVIAIQFRRGFRLREWGPFLVSLFNDPKYLIILYVEGFYLLYRILFGYFTIRKELRPISDLAEMTYVLSEKEVHNDEEKFRLLEEAIDNIKLTGDDFQLSTGDKELMGLEEAVNNLISRMRESYREQARFVSDASHELRTPIAVIKGYADMLDRWGKTDQTVLSESIDAIKTESDHMNYLVEQLLFLARGDNGRNQMTFADFDLSELLQEVFEEYRMIDADHRYYLAAIDGLTVHGDISMLKQAMRILMDNAKKYTDAGGEIRLRGSINAQGVYFSVQDNGIGIHPKDLPHVFDRFYRADDSRARDTGGTGLGLSIAKWIIDKHHGRFRVISRPCMGTKVTVYLGKA